MRFALLILFVLMWWPFHRKPVGVPTPEGLVHFPDSYCPHTDEGYFFLGPDGMIGISKDSCDAAFSDWNTNTAAPPTVARI